MIEERSGAWYLAGDITFANVVAERAVGEKMITAQKIACLDLSKLGSNDSSVLALLLAWKRCAKQGGWDLHYVNFSKNLRSLAQVCNLQKILE